MLNVRTAGVMAALCALLAGAALLLDVWTSGGSSGALAVSRVGPSTGNSPDDRDRLDEPRTASRRDIAAGAPLEADLREPVSARSATEDKVVGAIEGFVYDADGQPVPFARVLFARDGGLSFADRKFRVTAGEDGGFRVDGVPVGPWVAWSSTVSVPSDDALVWAGELLVAEGINYHDVVLFGRSLKGRFTVSDKDLDGLSLLVELVDRSAPTERVVAHASLWHSKEAPWKAPVDAQDSERPPLPSDGSRLEASPPPQGTFVLEGLEPRQYVLRISPSASVSAGGQELELYLEQKVDLIDFDVTLPPKEFRLDEFVVAALERRGRAR